jgi:cytochrome P450
VGAPLARQEIEVSVAGLVRRFPEMQLTAEPSYHPNFVIRGLSGLQLRG